MRKIIKESVLKVSPENETKSRVSRASPWILVVVVLALSLLTAVMPAASAGKLPASAAITSLNTACSGISVTGTGSYQAGIGRSDFVLIDTTKDPFTNLVDSKYFYYSQPRPKQVTESWSSTVPLTPGTQYRVFFHVWDNSGMLEALARTDFTCGS